MAVPTGVPRKSNFNSLFTQTRLYARFEAKGISLPVTNPGARR